MPLNAGIRHGQLTNYPRTRIFRGAISYAQFGGRHPSAKPWRGAGSGVFEIVQDHRGDTYRAVYSVRFPGVVYVLHCFQKKSPTGTKTSRRDISLLNTRLGGARGFRGSVWQQ